MSEPPIPSLIVKAKRAYLYCVNLRRLNLATLYSIDLAYCRSDDRYGFASAESLNNETHKVLLMPSAKWPK